MRSGRMRRGRVRTNLKCRSGHINEKKTIAQNIFDGKFSHVEKADVMVPRKKKKESRTLGIHCVTLTALLSQCFPHVSFAHTACFLSKRWALRLTVEYVLYAFMW
ncbi:hypothetical protein POVWA2_006550 [Plasmodium ovale wallikeri]|uniref:Uncharacterized protein n=1 Tax=Plasmodium ovale wallikeri TaxID=864142 RepID=A0A1A8YKI0_PLAOA|nr:hypothetical protein POVWA2_006550 [Plasmodium ovale wallikeri]